MVSIDRAGLGLVRGGNDRSAPGFGGWIGGLLSGGYLGHRIGNRFEHGGGGIIGMLILASGGAIAGMKGGSWLDDKLKR